LSSARSTLAKERLLLGAEHAASLLRQSESRRRRGWQLSRRLRRRWLVYRGSHDLKLSPRRSRSRGSLRPPGARSWP
jgi:hypothetical protein